MSYQDMALPGKTKYSVRFHQSNVPHVPNVPLLPYVPNVPNVPNDFVQFCTILYNFIQFYTILDIFIQFYTILIIKNVLPGHGAPWQDLILCSISPEQCPTRPKRPTSSICPKCPKWPKRPKLFCEILHNSVQFHTISYNFTQF